MLYIINAVKSIIKEINFSEYIFKLLILYLRLQQ